MKKDKINTLKPKSIRRTHKFTSREEARGNLYYGIQRQSPFDSPCLMQRIDTYHVPPIGMGKGLSHKYTAQGLWPWPGVEVSGRIVPFQPRSGLEPRATPTWENMMRFYNQPHRFYCGIDFDIKRFWGGNASGQSAVASGQSATASGQSATASDKRMLHATGDNTLSHATAASDKMASQASHVANDGGTSRRCRGQATYTGGDRPPPQGMPARLQGMNSGDRVKDAHTSTGPRRHGWTCEALSITVDLGIPRRIARQQLLGEPIPGWKSRTSIISDDNGGG